jgi:hypothetical protein
MTWTIDQFSAHASDEVLESFLDHNLPAAMMIGGFSICTGYPVIHRLYMHHCQPYQALTRKQQVVVIQHTIEAILLSLLFAPFTYLMLSVHFEEQPIESFHKKATVILSFTFTIVIMYLVKIASRYENPRPLVIIHHMFTYAADCILDALYVTDANVKAGSILVYMICYEAITFWGLIMYRLYPTNKVDTTSSTCRYLFHGFVLSSAACLDVCESHLDLGTSGKVGCDSPACSCSFVHNFAAVLSDNSLGATLQMPLETKAAASASK